MTQLDGVDAKGLEALEILRVPLLLVEAGDPPAVRYANDAAADLLDLPATDLAVVDLPAVDLPGPVAEALVDALGGGSPTRGAQQRRVTIAGRTLLLCIDPRPGSPQLVEALVTLLDVDALALPRVADVDAVLAMVDEALGRDELAERALRRALEVTGARRGILAELDGDVLRRSTVLDSGAPEGDGQCDRQPAPAAEPTGGLTPADLAAVPQGLVHWTGEGPAPLPHLTGPGWSPALVCALPGDRSRLVLVVADPVAGAFAGVDADRLRLLAALLVTAWRNVELRRDRAALARMLRGALEATAELTEARTPASVRQRMLGGLVERLGVDAAALWERDAEVGGLDLVAQVGLPPGVEATVRRLSPGSTAFRLASQPLAEEEQPPVSSSSSWPGRSVRLVEVPGPVRGVLGVYATDPLPPLVDGILATLAHALASATQLTRAHSRSRSVLDALQAELRPTGIGLPPSVDVGWSYSSALADVDVGGDFYDVLVAADGLVGVVCGDVCGKGIEAASLTAMAVHATRAYARDGDPPQRVLADLNEMACERTGDERFLTLAYAKLDPTSGAVSLGLAGHPPPVLLGADGPSLVAAEVDLPVGILAGETYRETTLHLAPGDRLVFYTDGVTEARAAGSPDRALLGADGLLAILDRAGDRSAAAVAEHVWDEVQRYTGGVTGDDCCIVVLGWDGA
jgi:hypothetical protein